MSALRWDAAWREQTWAGLDQQWDLIVVGGGIAGAGIARAAARSGLRPLLLEQEDFGWGASSRSSQLVHGGLRYLARVATHRETRSRALFEAACGSSGNRSRRSWAARSTRRRRHSRNAR